MIDHGYKKLEIYKRAHRLAVEVHATALRLPKFEMFEEGSQVRRSSKSVSSQIVEGYSLRKNKKEFLQYLSRAYASATETKEHLELLFETKSLNDEALFNKFVEEYELLCAKIFRFIKAVMEEHEKPYYLQEENAVYEVKTDLNQDPTIDSESSTLSDSEEQKSEIRNLKSEIRNRGSYD